MKRQTDLLRVQGDEAQFSTDRSAASQARTGDVVRAEAIRYGWSVDFMSDALARGCRFRTLNVIDDFNRVAVHIEVNTSITRARLVRIFDADQTQPRLAAGTTLRQSFGIPRRDIHQWAKTSGVAIQYI